MNHTESVGAYLPTCKLDLHKILS